MTDHTSEPSIGSEATIVRVTANGSISLPAAIRRRWGATRVAVIDRGDLAVVRAVPDNPIEYYRGRFAGPGPTSDELRAIDRAAETKEERAKDRRVRR